MPLWRKLHVKIKDSEDVNSLPDDFTRLLWVLLTVTVDSKGRGIYKSRWIMSHVFPLREDITPKMVDASMKALEERKMISGYEVDGKKYFHIPTFCEYQQTAKEADSLLPGPTQDLLRTYSGPTQEFVSTKSVTDADADKDANADKELELDTANEPISEVQRTIEKLIGLMPSTPDDEKAIADLTKAGALPEDITAGYNWVKGANDRPITRYSTLVNPTRTAMARRLQSGNGHNPPPFKTGENGRVQL